MNRDSFFPAECAVFPSGGGSVLLRNRNDGRVLELPEFQARLFLGLAGCVPREAHLETLMMQNRRNLPASSLAGLIENWIGAGLLRPESLLTSRETGALQKPASKPLSCAVLTCGRSSALSEWLDSRISHPHFAERRVPLMVFDDSTDEAVIRDNRAIADAAHDRYPGAVGYFGAAEKQALRDGLVEAGRTEGIGRELIDFALYGPPDTGNLVRIGANRNAALLHNGFGPLLFSDDDLFYRVFRSPDAELELLRCSPGEHSPVRFFPSMEALDEYARQDHEYDLPGEIERYLSAPVQIDPSVDRAMLTPSMARRIETGTAGIGAVSAGYFGGRWFDDYPLAPLRRSLADDSFYLDQEEYTEVTRRGLNIIAAEAVTLADGDFLQSGTMALDGALALPPFFPVDRHEDPAFAVLFRSCCAGSYVLRLPVALYHDPQQKPPIESGSWNMTPSAGQMHKLIVQNLTRQFLADSGEERLREAGRRYRELALLSNSDFEEYLRSLYTLYVQRTQEFIAYQLTLFDGGPPWWAADMQQIDALLTENLEDPLRELPEGFQSWLGLYGELIEAWPVLRKSAATEPQHANSS